MNNNPLRYTDPTGHIRVENEGGGGYKGCSDPRYCQNGKPKPSTVNPTKSNKPKGKNGSNGECTTITCKALQGNLLAIRELLVPTHFGWRGQLELSISPTGLSIGPSGTLGLNIAYNRVSGELAAFADWTLEGGGGMGLPVGVSFTEGPIIGWGSSTVKDVAEGNAATISGTAAYEGALSASVSTPVDGDSLSTLRPHIDPIYGQMPATVYLGGGIGGAYAGGGGGASHVFDSVIVDLSP